MSEEKNNPRPEYRLPRRSGQGLQLSLLGQGNVAPKFVYLSLQAQLLGMAQLHTLDVVDVLAGLDLLRKDWLELLTTPLAK